jgi:hypothetical protein
MFSRQDRSAEQRSRRSPDGAKRNPGSIYPLAVQKVFRR